MVITHPLIEEGCSSLEELSEVGLSTLRVPVLETHHQVREVVECSLKVFSLEGDHHPPVMLILRADTYQYSQNPNQDPHNS